jgi:hypothetical protein
MTRSSPETPINTFVIRFWRDWSAAGPRWHGWIDHVQSGERTAFRDLEGMVGFLRCFGIMAPAGDESQSEEEDC